LSTKNFVTFSKELFFDIGQADYFSVVLSICFIDYICIVKQHMNVLNINSANKNFTRAQDVVIPEIYGRRFKTGYGALDELFGNQGFIPGQMITVAAGAGTGKSCFLLQMMQALENVGKRTAYISGEENLEQVSFTCKRLGVSTVPLANMTDIDEIEQAVVEHKIEFLVLDSYPTLTTKKKMNLRQKEEYIVGRLVRIAKENEACIAIVLHMNKDGKTFRGTTLLNHSIDTFLTIGKNPDDMHLRDFMIHKNRFGGGSFVSFEFGVQGYTFEAVEDTSNETPMTKTKKTSKADIILGALTTPKTAAQIVEETNVGGAYLTSILRELVTQGKAEKNGRGAEATYIKK
jgi:predicted ATP-dependent serine protease